jgi:hypothetical protein
MALTNADSNAISLSEYAVLSNDPLIQKLTFSLHQTGNILQDIPFTTKSSLKMRGSRFTGLNGTLPTIGWRRLNEAPSATKGRPTPYEEQAMIMSNVIQIDAQLINDDMTIGDPLQNEINAYMEALKYEVNYRFLLNDPTDPTNGDVDAWAGIKYRLDNPSLYNIPTEMKVIGIEGAGTGSPIVATASMTATNANDFIASIQTALDYMGAPDGEGVVMYTNDLVKRRLERAIRIMGAGAGFDITKDAFDRPVESYKAMKIRDIGRRADQVTRILGDETLTGGTWATGSKYASLYFVRYGAGLFEGWQKQPLKPQFLGLDPTNGTQYNVLIDWACGLWQPNNRSIARIQSIQTS